MNDSTPQPGKNTRTTGRLCLEIYLVISFILILGLVLLILRDGIQGFYLIQGPADVATVKMKFVITCIAWLFTGGLLVVAQFPGFARRHAAFLLVLVPLAFIYLNDVREPHKVEYGDLPAYYLAAVDISNNQPINQQSYRLY